METREEGELSASCRDENVQNVLISLGISESHAKCLAEVYHVHL